MNDTDRDHELRAALLTAFPAPDGTERGDWERLLRLATSRPTLVGRASRHRSPRLVANRKVRLAVALAAALIVLLVAGVAIADKAGLVDVYIPGLGRSLPETPQKAAAIERIERRQSDGTTDVNTNPAPAPKFTRDLIPAHMLPPGTPVPIAPSILQVTNDWLVSDGYTLVAVYAGAAGNDGSEGRVVIFRQDLVKGTQSVTPVDAGKTGALTISDAPAGAAVEKSAQTGDIELHAADGSSLVLHLATDTISRG